MIALLRSAFATRPLRLILATWTLASVGGWSFMVALSVYAYQEAGAAGVAIAALVRMLPAGLAAPLAGLLADRRARRDVLLAACIARALFLALMAAAIAADAPFAVVLVLAAAFTVSMTAHRPAHLALLPQLAGMPSQLAAANAATSALDNAGFMVGALLGGALVAATGVEAAFVGAGLALALAAGVVTRISVDPVPAYRGRADAALDEVGGGLRAVAADRDLRLVVGLLAGATLAEGAVDVLVVLIAFEALDVGAAGVGWLNAAWGIGGLAGGAAALLLLGRGRLASGLAFGGLLVGIPLTAVSAVPETVVALGALATLGVGYALIEVAGATLLQRLTSDELLCRVAAVMESSYWIATGLGAMLAPLLVSALGVRGALAVVGAALPLIVAAKWAALARLEAGHPVPERVFVRLRKLPLFAPMPPGTVETLALRAMEVPVAAGDVIIREGDAGDRFYAVESGRLEISRAGVRQAVVASGGFVGETALLRKVPRTATATALEDGLLYALDGEVFVETITGHHRAGEAADAVIAERQAALRHA